MARVPLRRRPGALILLAFIGVGVLVGALAAYRLLRVSRDLTAGKNALVQIEPRLRAQDLQGAKRLMAAADARILHASTRLHNSPEISLVNVLPVVHQNVKAIRDSVDLALTMADAGTRMLDTAAPLANASGKV